MTVSLNKVKAAWRKTAGQRGFHFGFNLKTLVAGERATLAWGGGIYGQGVWNTRKCDVSFYLPPADLRLAETLRERKEIPANFGVQEIHWDDKGSHTSAVHAVPTLQDFAVNAVLINHSEVIAEHGRTLEQAAAQLRMAINASAEGRTFNFITLCVGEDMRTHESGSVAASGFVRYQIGMILGGADIKPYDMERIGIAYEPRGAIQVGDKPGIPPPNGHIMDMGWTILQAVADIVGVDAMAKMFALQYGGSMKGPEDRKAPVQRFVGPGNEIDKDLFNGGLIGTAGKDPETVAAILNKVVTF